MRGGSSHRLQRGSTVSDVRQGGSVLGEGQGDLLDFPVECYHKGLGAFSPFNFSACLSISHQLATARGITAAIDRSV